jgi:hypothetical protein
MYLGFHSIFFISTRQISERQIGPATRFAFFDTLPPNAETLASGIFIKRSGLLVLCTYIVKSYCGMEAITITNTLTWTLSAASSRRAGHWGGLSATLISERTHDNPLPQEEQTNEEISARCIVANIYTASYTSFQHCRRPVPRSAGDMETHLGEVHND